MEDRGDSDRAVAGAAGMRSLELVNLPDGTTISDSDLALMTEKARDAALSGRITFDVTPSG